MGRIEKDDLLKKVVSYGRFPVSRMLENHYPYKNNVYNSKDRYDVTICVHEYIFHNKGLSKQGFTKERWYTEEGFNK